MKTASFTFQEGGPIRGVEDFLRKIKRFAGPGDYRIYFRGHGQPVDALVPSVGRRHYYLGKSLLFDDRAERHLLEQFRRHAYEHLGRIPNEWETLFLARHYGLPTRLLDWTSNPLVALYFAAFYESESLVEGRFETSAKLDCDGTLWGIKRRQHVDDLDLFTENRSPLKIPGVKLVFPFHATPRLTAQSGVFTLHANPQSDLAQQAGRRFPASDLDISALIRWKVQSRHKTGIVLELERLAINSRMLFPDLEGLARGLWQTEVIRHCFSDT